MRRQPEIGSALGLTTDEVLSRTIEREKALVELRTDLISALGNAIEDLNRRVPPVDVVAALYHATEGMLTRWRC